MDKIVRMSEEDMLWFACEIAWGRAPFKFMPQQQHIHREWRGWREMVGQINRSDPDLVLDFGCGDNLYSHTGGTELLYPQDRIINLQGVDLVNRNADLSCDYRYLGEFGDGTVDNIISIDGINIGQENIINDALSEAHRLLKRGGRLYMRGVMDEGHYEHFYYTWTKEKIAKWSRVFGFGEVQAPRVVRLSGNLMGNPWYKGVHERLEIARNATENLVNHYFISNQPSDERLWWIWEKE